LLSNSHNQILQHGLHYSFFPCQCEAPTSCDNVQAGLEKELAPKPEVKNSAGAVISPAVPVDEDKLELWEIKAERAARALKTTISSDLRVPIRGCEDGGVFHSINPSVGQDSHPSTVVGQSTMKPPPSELCAR
jgi:hypothetical protein